MDSSSGPRSPTQRRSDARLEASATLDSVLPSASATEIYRAQTEGRMRSLLSGGAPSDAYAASIGVSRGSKLGVEAPRQLNREEVRAVVTADRVTAALGGTELAERVLKARPFEPRMLTGEDIKRQQNESTVFLRGPEDSPALKASAAQPRPVVAYTLDKPAPAPAFGSTEAGRALQSSSFSLSQMAPPARAAHDVPAHVRGGRSAEEAAAASAAMVAATSAAQEAHKAKQRGLTAQWAISQAGGGK